MKTNAQLAPKTYSPQWKIVEEAMQKGLPKSALEEVNKIYKQAKAEKQDAQVIKAVTHMIGLNAENQENFEQKSIDELKKEISETQGAVKAILTSFLAKKYLSYYYQHRWQLYERTAVEGAKSEDITTWSTGEFHKKITQLYLESLQPEADLKKTLLAPFDEIIQKGNVRKLRPTLYDLLAQEALQYFSSDERNIKKPTYAFEISTASAFDPAADFAHRKFESKDSTELEYFALTLYQKLVAFHLEDPKPDALIDIDLQRLQYVRQKSVHPDKEQLYYMAVNHIAQQYESIPAAAQAWCMVAAWHNDRGNGYEPFGDTTARFERVKAAEICDKIIRENPNSEGGINAHNLLNTIREKSISFQTENVNVPEKPFLALFNYRNIDRVFLRIVPATDEVKKKMERQGEGLWNDLVAAKPIRSWQQVLPDTKDHQEHLVEIKIDALPIGEYILIASSGADFTNPKALLGARLVIVSNISYVRNGQDMFVLNRDNGQPIPSATVKISQMAFDYNLRINKKLKSDQYITDLNGHIKTAREDTIKNYWTEQVEITTAKDKLALPAANRTYYREEADVEEYKTFLFTDRSIYRPGQTVFFKGIVCDSTATSSSSTDSISVVLTNANGEEVEKKEFRTNEYGSFSGSFQLPKNALNGTFKIVTDDLDEISFQVEEYKRPKFEVSFDTLKVAYKVNDIIRITGVSRAYAGNAIDGAKVSYRVTRVPRYIYRWRSKSWLPPVSPLEIAHGETTTDVTGKFLITFEALPDLKIDKKQDPVFDYDVKVDITDSNGETRSEYTKISVSYKSILLRADIPDKIFADSLKSLSIRTENINGEFLPAEVKVIISSLTPETRLIRERYWARPDQFVISKADYIQDFPHDEYNDETDPTNWVVKNVVLEKSQMLQNDKDFALSEANLPAGFYRIEVVTQDQSGEEIKEVKYTELIKSKSDKSAQPVYLSTTASKPIEPGETASIQIGSSADHLFLISKTGQKAKQTSPFSFSQLNNQVQTFRHTATEEDRGGYVVSYLFVKHNRIYEHQETIHVPWTNKELRIEYLTFRDKTLPGSKEQWKVKISGYKKEKIAAEMLASMYDASLDQFVLHHWQKPNLHLSSLPEQNWDSYRNFKEEAAYIRYVNNGVYRSNDKIYDRLLLDDFYEIKSAVIADKTGRNRRIQKAIVGANTKMNQAAPEEEMSMAIGGNASALAEVVTVGYGVQKTPASSKNPTAADIAPRKNFNETAFFLPELRTNEDGEIEFSFTLPEALTRWKFQALVHTKDLAFGYSSKEIITRKELMVQPNAPRFLREGDQINFPVKVANISDQALTGTVSLQLFDTETNQPVDVQFKNQTGSQPFSIQAGQNTNVSFSLEVPKGFTKTLTWRAVAKAGNLSDGEENILPVLSNRMLVTESLTLNVRGAAAKDFRFEKLLSSGNSKTLTHQKLTVEYTSNPAWYAVQALPYLMEYPYECAEQTWNRYYANALAAQIVSTSPRIAKVFETWKNADTTALMSNLEKNQELKSVLLEETPWVLQAKSESGQKRNIALLFDLVKMKSELTGNLEKLLQMQSENGSFPWFKGGYEDRYITQYIVTGIGHLAKTGFFLAKENRNIEPILDKALSYLDKKIKEDYDNLIKYKSDLKQYAPGPVQVQYLYLRSFFADKPVASASQKAYQYFRERAGVTWVTQSKYLQGMIALTLNRGREKVTAKAILKSLRETAVVNEEMGMYWKSNQRGWWWYEAPIERQALLIEAFQEIENDTKTVDALKTWLLKNKQTNAWESTKATAEACYALLMQGSNWLTEDKTALIHLGETTIQSDANSPEAGTGYFKKSFESDQISVSMGNVHIETKSETQTSAPSWGAVYWQYFEDLDKIIFAETPLKLSKKLFIERNTDKGPTLTAINEGDKLHIGDKITVRIELRADRDMEYVHMKDMRASGLEPVNVLSSYKWQGGLGYYETTKDASTNFFFSAIRKGTYVFEYPLFVAHEGDFSNGVTSIQCMYAPEFTAHSEGVRVRVGK
ncbi:alpha-2-macroglobulin family protein [Dyadobacter luticola]|nr:alpha-2-macroglobulin family protein [Dyadobacter luticola]